MTEIDLNVLFDVRAENEHIAFNEANNNFPSFDRTS